MPSEYCSFHYRSSPDFQPLIDSFFATSVTMAPSSFAMSAAFLSTGLISLAPNVILFLFPSYSSTDGARFLSLGQAMAAGGLLGDVFQHTLPHASRTDQAGLWILAGFTLFFTVDLLIRSLETRAGKTHYHSHSNHQSKASESSNHAHSTSMSLVVLNLTADALHNFTDGLAIGASYAAASATTKETSLLSMLTSRGGLASISILLHEVPHELGDYCTLIRSGYTKGQAIRAQFMTAIAAFMGTAVALFAIDTAHNETLLFVTAGGFLYMAATTILPEVLQDEGSVSFRLTQLLSFLSGVVLLFLVALMEDDHHHDGHHHHSHEHNDQSHDVGHHHHDHAAAHQEL